MPPDIPLKDVLNKCSVFFHITITTHRENLDFELLKAPDNLPPVLRIQDAIPGGKLNTFRILASDYVQKLIMKLTMKSCVLNPLPTWLLNKFIKPHLYTMTHIIKKSLESSVFPNTLEEAR